jgi:hypothetical protein
MTVTVAVVVVIAVSKRYHDIHVDASARDVARIILIALLAVVFAVLRALAVDVTRRRIVLNIRGVIHHAASDVITGMVAPFSLMIFGRSNGRACHQKRENHKTISGYARHSTLP